MSQETPHSTFPRTRWTLIAKSTVPAETAGSRKAMEELCEIYWYPLYAWLRQSGYRTHEAEDLTQSFFQHILEKDLFQKAETDRGRMRSFLLGALRYHIADVKKAENAEKRGGDFDQTEVGKSALISIDAALAEDRYRNEPQHSESPDQMYMRRWALTVLENALRQVRELYSSQDKTELFTALSPLLGWNERIRPQAEIAEELGMTAGALRVALNRMRGKLRDAVRVEVADSVDSEADVGAEVRILLDILSS